MHTTTNQPVQNPNNVAGTKNLLIDNTRTVYRHIRLKCGVPAFYQADVALTCPDILTCLDADIAQCLAILPTSVHSLVRRTSVWINLTYCYGLRDQPQHVNHTTTHHHAAWLVWARDVPEKANGIEIYSALDYIRMRSHWNGCGLILHELCHHIHQQTFGLDCETIKQEYTRALQSGRYDRVLRRDSASNRDGAFDLAYAMIDHKEFFAEMSVTHWSHYYAHLDNASCTQLQSCSPPTIKELTPCSFSKNPISWFRSSFTPRRNPCSHCNKFYPFTQGQLRHYDPCLAKAMEAFWLKIAEWDDPCDNNTQCDGCWAHPRGSKHIAAVDVLEDVTWPDGINDTVNL